MVSVSDITQDNCGLQSRGSSRRRSLEIERTTTDPRTALPFSPGRRAVALGWFSVGLGVAQIFAPQHVARLIGLSNDSSTRATLRVIGIRELACGVGMLVQPESPTWAWGRVAGDVIDLALLGRTLTSGRADARKASAALAGVLAVGLVDAQAASELARRPRQPARSDWAGVYTLKTITVNQPAEAVYRFWRDFENLSQFMAHLKSVQVDNARSHWCARGPLGTRVEWDAEVIEDRPNEFIAWRSVANADIASRGSVSFRPAPGGHGTEITVELCYDPPAGKLGATLAKLFGKEPGQQISGDLRRLKQVLETGEVLHSDASIHRGMHPARPSGKVLTRNKEMRS